MSYRVTLTNVEKLQATETKFYLARAQAIHAMRKLAYSRLEAFGKIDTIAAHIVMKAIDDCDDILPPRDHCSVTISNTGYSLSIEETNHPATQPNQEIISMLAKNKEKSSTPVTITEPRFERAVIKLKSTAPYVQNRFSSRVQKGIQDTMQEGSAKKKVRKAKPPKDFEAAFRDSLHISTEGWYGIPATAFRAAMVDATRLTEQDMIRAKMAIKVIGNGLDKENFEPLVKMKCKPPRMHVERVRIGINSMDLASRGMFDEWSADVEVEWDADIFTASDIVNLMARAGWQVGVGAGRPLSRSSVGRGWGTWSVEG